MNMSTRFWFVLLLVTHRTTVCLASSGKLLSPKGRLALNGKDPTSCSTHCDVRRCTQVYPETCEGWIERDSCGCCPVCNTSRPSVLSVVSTPQNISYNPGVCKEIRCSRRQQCFVNIQGIPFCRCPSSLLCPTNEQTLCDSRGKVYPSLCHVKVAECEQKRRISIDLCPSAKEEQLTDFSPKRPRQFGRHRSRLNEKEDERKLSKMNEKEDERKLGRLNSKDDERKLHSYYNKLARVQRKENRATRKQLADKQANKFYVAQ